MALSKELFPAGAALLPAAPGHRGDRPPDRRRRRTGLLPGSCARPPPRTAVVVGDLTGIDLPRLLDDTLGGWTGSAADAPPAPRDHRGRHRPRVVIVDRPGAVQTQLLIGRTGADRHDPVWAAQVSAPTAWAAP